MQTGTVRSLYSIRLNYVEKNYEKFINKFNLILRTVVHDINKHNIFKKNIVLVPKKRYPKQLLSNSYLLSSKNTDSLLDVNIGLENGICILHICSNDIIITNTDCLVYRYYIILANIDVKYKVKLVVNDYLHNCILHVTNEFINIKFSRKRPKFNVGDIIKSFSYVYNIYV